MKFLRNLSIQNKLILISAIPLLALIYFLQGIITGELRRRQVTNEIYRNFQEVEKISDLIHELQKERGLTVTFLRSNTRDDRDQMISQREATNSAVTGVQDIYRQHEKATLATAALDSLTSIRTDLNNLPQEVNTLKSVLMREISVNSRLSQNPDIKNMLEAHLFLLYSKDYLSRIRATLAGSILSGGFQKGEYGEYSSSKGQHEINLYKFRESAPSELRSFFEKRATSSPAHHMYSMMDSVFKNPDFLRSVSHDSWWVNSSEAINMFKETEDYSLERIKERAESELTAINNSVITNIIVATLIIMLIGALVVFMIREIVSAISKIKTAAERMTNGEVDFSIAVNSSDEIGDLATSFNRMITVTKEYSRVADVIGRGDYSSSVIVRSDSDTLGKALNSMKDNLQKLSRDNEIRTWLLTGNTELNDKMRGEKDVSSLAQEIINQLTTYLRAQIGAIYLKENGQLSLVGSYAFNSRKGNASSFELGQGFIGQSALEKKAIVFNDIPDDYIRINSGLGNAVPRNIIVFPFLHDNDVKGVIEIGSSREFSDLDMQFLQMVADNIGISVNASQSRDRLKDLLEETQRQAEELEVQQEELRQANEELQSKTELLEKSEAELKTQQEELQQTNEELEEKANLLEDQKQTMENAKMQVETKARELEATSKYKSEFLANMSHELRTPLNSILILSQILLENKTKSLGEKEVQFASNIYNSGSDLLNLINEILDLAKVEAGKMELDIHQFSIDDVVADTKGMFTEIAANKSIQFDVQVDDTIASALMSTDKQRLGQILRNLLSNAFKFTSKNGRVELSIRPAEKNTVFKRNELTGVDGVVAFSVTDSGIGIPHAKLNIIFEAFQQVDGSTKRKYGGTGLGLSISRELAYTLGGEIHVESEEGEGSTFTLYLPMTFDPSMIGSGTKQVAIRERTEVRERAEKAPSHKSAVAKISIEDPGIDDRNTIDEKSRVILIMEDDPAFAEVLLNFVRERQYKGIIAYQGNSGLSFARHYKPDAIMLDMKLPVMDGAEVLKQLKNDPELRHIPVQIISGYDRKKEGLELGAFDYIKKPVTQEVLWEAFDRIESFVSRKVKHLLIIEDDKQHNDAVKELIGNGDVKSFSAYSGSEAFKMMSTNSFDCIIVDLGLPDMSGFEFLEKMRDNKNLLQTPVIVYTGKDLTKDERTRLEKLANTVVLKTAYSHDRLLDETMLFLHRLESRLPKEKQNLIRKLHKSDEVLKNKKVLVVDDDIRNVYSLTHALDLEGMICTTAENGKEALKLLRQNGSFDIVLMDVMMPEMDGYEATREIRKIDKFKKLPIIALTAKAMKGDREKCLAVGMSDYISKPLNVERLVSLMRVWLYA
jgi:CheY-like chemotaxis protein/HAMP domain-containing protein/putative methionine-R-sulfoxide reductase with GAF domain